MLKFESFNLPTDGLTRVAQIGHYNNKFENEGWSLVGLCEAVSEDDDKRTVLYGVYRLSGDEALVSTTKALAAAEQKAREAEQKAYGLKHDLEQTTHATTRGTRGSRARAVRQGLRRARAR
jgi:F0F1-type ATP synthase epsilon subunit